MIRYSAHFFSHSVFFVCFYLKIAKKIYFKIIRSATTAKAKQEKLFGCVQESALFVLFFLSPLKHICTYDAECVYCTVNCVLESIYVP